MPRSGMRRRRARDCWGNDVLLAHSGAEHVHTLSLLSPHARGDEFFQAHRVALARGLARLDASKAAGLDEPLPPRRKLPAALHGLARVPAYRFVLDVHHLVMSIEELDAVSVRIAQVDEERVAGAMAARPELDIGGKAHLGGQIADVEEVIGFRDRERGVMEPRPCPG